MKKRTKKTPNLESMVNINIRVPLGYKEWLERRATIVPGMNKSDVVRQIFKAERDREEARGERK